MTLTVLHSEWEANLAELSKPADVFPSLTTIGPEPTYTWVGMKRVEHRMPPSLQEITALRSFAAAEPGFREGVTESKGWQL